MPRTAIAIPSHKNGGLYATFVRKTNGWVTLMVKQYMHQFVCKSDLSLKVVQIVSNIDFPLEIGTFQRFYCPKYAGTERCSRYLKINCVFNDMRIPKTAELCR